LRCSSAWRCCCCAFRRWRDALLLLNHVVYAVERATAAGAGFVFGYLGGGNAPFDVTAEGALYIFAFRVLPQIIVFSVLVALLWYWRVLPLVISAFGAVLRRALGVRGAVGTSAAASVFLGMVETPLVIRAYLQTLSRSELFTLMTCGMSTVAGRSWCSMPTCSGTWCRVRSDTC
jgi:concentrative nucleoside transporter, CNT family